MIKIIATVGTSVITNFMDKDVIKAMPNGKKEDANIADLYDSLLQTPNDRNAGKLKEKIEKYFLFNMEKESGTKNWKYSEQKGNVNLHCSAEVYSISEIIKQKPNETYEIALITTDTAIAKVAAELIAIGLTKISAINSIETKTVQNLQVENGKELSDVGFNNLISCYDEIIKKAKGKDKKCKFILNITGGYKGIIPFSTIYGLVAEISLNYIYEDSNSLVKLENIPITFDWTAAELAGPYLDPTWFFSIKHNNNVISMLQHFGFVDKNKKITALGFLLKKVIDESYPEGKETLGMLAEYKLFEYYCNHDKIVREKYRVSRSVLINDNPQNGEKGNEIDLLLEAEENSPIYIRNWVHGNKKGVIPIDNHYITNEVKGFFQVKSGAAIKQFDAFLEHLLTFWKDSKPREIRYITWQLLKNGLPSNAEDAIRPTLIQMKKLVKDKLGDEKLFQPYLLTIGINPNNDNAYVNMMQKQIQEKDFKLIQL